MGVLPTSRTKKSSSMSCVDTDRREGSRRSSFPKRVGWFEYWVRTYSFRAHWDFSWTRSIWDVPDSPQASVNMNRLWLSSRLQATYREALHSSYILTKWKCFKIKPRSLIYQLVIIPYRSIRNAVIIQLAYCMYNNIHYAINWSERWLNTTIRLPIMGPFCFNQTIFGNITLR